MADLKNIIAKLKAAEGAKDSAEHDSNLSGAIADLEAIVSAEVHELSWQAKEVLAIFESFDAKPAQDFTMSRFADHLERHGLNVDSFIVALNELQIAGLATRSANGAALTEGGFKQIN